MSIPTLEAVQNAERIINWLATHPENHDQGTWWTGADEMYETGVEVDVHEVTTRPWGNNKFKIEHRISQGAANLQDVLDCGTSCCFAGALGLDLVGPLYASLTRSGDVFVQGKDGFEDVSHWAADYLGIARFGGRGGEISTNDHPFEPLNNIHDLVSFATWLRRCHEGNVDAAVEMVEQPGCWRADAILAEAGL